MSSLHNDLDTWASKARIRGQETIYIDLETAYLLARSLRELEFLRDAMFKPKEGDDPSSEYKSGGSQ